ncbi:unannotated protein [freshwater metagenome]|uniref:Unannotated protein n=1 Tax=freshwater metagenome TaxID=449393 RepID=A0A6J7EDH2_9ZZZZ|nr:FtsX-like permease family protein [Actinomycetota bacterium]
MLFWRWSLRDLRRRWLSVVAIAIVIAIGTGVFAGLGSTSAWRRSSNDASYALLHMHDLELRLSPGTIAPQGALAALVADLTGTAMVTAVQERLIVSRQVDASTGSKVVLVPGELVGADLSPDAGVDRLSISSGTRPQAGGGGGGGQVILEEKFAQHYHLADTGSLVLAGGTPVRYTGVGVSPEYFLITGVADAGFLAEANYAVVFTGLAESQRLAGLAGQVNDIVIGLAPGTDRDAIGAQLAAAVRSNGALSGTVETRDDDPAYRLMYDDIGGDQKLWNVLSALILIAASIAAFNLIGRIVDAQRREIGVQMALGASPARIVRRPVLVAAQIALLGALLGVVVGLVVGAAMRGLLVSLLPLPVWSTPFQVGTFLRAAVLGFVLPFVASVLPVRRAVRVEPVDAIRTTHLAVRGTRLTALSRRFRIRRHADSLRRLPLRNVLRAPRRTLLTALGVGAAVSALVGVMGMLDTFNTTIRIGEHELLVAAPDRVMTRLDGFQLVAGAVVDDIRALPQVRSADPELELPAIVYTGSRTTEIDLLLQVLVLHPSAGSDSWAPSISRAAPAGGRPGIVLAAKAAVDLGVRPGDVVTVQHPLATGPTSYTMRDTDFTVIGVHPSPLRSLAFVDSGNQSVFGLTGVTNVIQVRPAVGTTGDDLRRALFDMPGVASAQPVAAITDLFRKALEQFLSFLLIAAVAVLVLALLIAFNSTSISVDERTREHATMFAFGLPIRSVFALIAKESVIVGVFSTLTGLGIGYLLVRWMMISIVGSIVPDFGFTISISAMTLGIALFVGVASVGLTPLLLIRRLRRMDIPDALRIME